MNKIPEQISVRFHKFYHMGMQVCGCCFFRLTGFDMPSIEGGRETNLALADTPVGNEQFDYVVHFRNKRTIRAEAPMAAFVIPPRANR